MNLGGQKYSFPVEIQIVDEARREQNETGDTSHEAYVTKQIAAVRRRVTGANLSTKYDKL